MDSRHYTAKAHQIIGARAGGRVERCHAIPHHGSYNVAAHSWGVALLMLQFWPEDFPRLAAACITHDIPEAWTGDVIATVMRYVPGLKEKLAELEDKLMARLDLPEFNNLSPQDHLKVKTCDWIEFYLWCREQAAQGNQFAREGQKEIEEYIDRMGIPDPAHDIFRKLRQMDIVSSQAGVIKSLMEKV